jgi:hypothetical protein
MSEQLSSRLEEQLNEALSLKTAFVNKAVPDMTMGEQRLRDSSFSGSITNIVGSSSSTGILAAGEPSLSGQLGGDSKDYEGEQNPAQEQIGGSNSYDTIALQQMQEGKMSGSYDTLSSTEGPGDAYSTMTEAVGSNYVSGLDDEGPGSTYHTSAGGSMPWEEYR